MNIQKANFGGGCFWCTEAVFTAVNGVNRVTSGYMGGRNEHPTYEQVCGGQTGHVEIIQIEYDGDVTDFRDLLLIFFKTHDPTTLNRQGADVGTQYRSVVFYESKEQKTQTEEMIAQLNAEKVFDNPIVTEVSPIETFYPAESYHQDYFINHRSQGYCMAVIEPKLQKFAKNFKDKIKPELL
ncbi:MAG: peptide-methionine (S)-S-oxide reductase MsrA [Bacteroidetes bacterium]|nr:peptide-methionine (S)-S-oxide reductase MsrA [Bacteroidota bacterium]MBU1373044.1 peptide-methionine (S)-S-oxide reductase MsrA [Bacteroidota bacterium]MBU1485487.1 peptide-methionine (S)-S-oxide reductase MsrA [Bacteroidota bacterium]MBU1761487.1 peptide-methionine (S)-S-oxide reductase MsrA [Bacteroidota bacterium]MBU2046528.1 peptide-methionine (S)-S-oxide reductase MsrA [Bacteroidota bacterium]